MKRQYTKPLMLAIPVEQQHLLTGSGDNQNATQNAKWGGQDDPTTPSSPANNNEDESIWSNGVDVGDDDQCAKGHRPFSEYMW